MKCSKCGENLNDDAIFCDKCGAFVMHLDCSALPDNGYRTRYKNHRSKALIVVFVAIISICVGIGSGYLIIYRDILGREATKYAAPNFKTPDEIWEKSLTSYILDYKNNSAQNGNKSKGN